MGNESDFIPRTIGQLGDLAAVEQQLKGLRVVEEIRSRAIIVTPGAAASPEARAKAAERRARAAELEEKAREVFDNAARAIQKIRVAGPGVELTRSEMIGYEAVIHTVGRPAILVRNGTFTDPPDQWKELEQERAAIEKAIKSVGRIECLAGGVVTMIGTGFLVAKDVVMTNHHVLEVFAVQRDAQWQFKLGLTPEIDYLREHENPSRAVFPLSGVIGACKAPDLALIRVRSESSDGRTLPEPLTLATHPPDTTSAPRVYVIGYPAIDKTKKTPPQILMDIFADVYQVKRLQPGEMTAVFDHEKVLSHDCSTLGGNSGSCVIDLKMNRVTGLHYSGEYREANFAVALWMLKDDPLLRKARVQFD